MSYRPAQAMIENVLPANCGDVFQISNCLCATMLVSGSKFCGGTPLAGKSFVLGELHRSFRAIFAVLCNSFNVSSVVAVTPRPFQRRSMTHPRVYPRYTVLIALVAMLAPGYVAQAEQPPAMSPPPVPANVAPPPRAKPQIIYRLPRNSNYAATLHSQAKTQSHPLPIDNSMSPSLQMSRSLANEAAAREQQRQQQLEQQQKQQQQQSAPKASSPRSQRVKPSKFHSNPPQMRKHGPGKGRGPGASRGKGRKK